MSSRQNNGGPSTETTPHRETLTSEVSPDTMTDCGGACNPAMREEYFLSMEEFAEVVRMSYEQVRRLVAQGKIKHLRLGRTVRIPSGVLHEYIGGR